MVGKKIITILAVVLFVTQVCCYGGPIIYVDKDANGYNNGTSWDDAYTYLQDALDDANSAEKPVEIRVAQGMYRPDRSSTEPNGTGDREATFQLIDGVTLEGGYAGPRMSLLGADPNARDIEFYETVLSGDLNGDDGPNFANNGENSYHVVTGSRTNETAVLDGLTISGGNANGWYNDDSGGGMYNGPGSSPTVTGCTFSGNCANYGGGMYNQDASPTVTKCTFSGNLAFIEDGEQYPGGGGMYNYRSSPTLINCTFSGNLVSCSYHEGGDGGGVFCDESSPRLVNCTFSRNSARRYGGGIANWWGGSPTLTNCTFSGNSAVWESGGLDNYEGNPKLTNCTFSGNSGGWSGGMYNGKGSPTLTNCTFSGNSANGVDGQGGGMSNDSGSSPTLTNCAFTGNSAGDDGGGMYNRGNPTLINCGFSGNSARKGGGMYNCDRSSGTVENCTFAANSALSGNALACDSYSQKYPSNVQLTNCVLWDSGNEIWNNDNSAITVTYSDVQGGWPGEGNIDVDPCFVEPGYWDPNGMPDFANDDFWVDGDYHLKSQAGRWDPENKSWVKDDVTSPCIDAGDPMSPIGLEPFPNGGIINMGAYGGTAEASKSYFGEPICETIVAGDINGDCKVNFLDFTFMALHWLEDNSP